MLIHLVAKTIAIGSAVALPFLAQKYGVFRKVEWTRGHMEKCRVAYIEHTGSYQQIGGVLDELIKYLSGRGITVTYETSRFMGIFYDDPAAVPADRLRSRACVFLPDNVVETCGLPVMDIEAREALTTEFPYFNVMSVYIAVARVYPALKKACSRDASAVKGAIYEVYDRPQRKITYYAPTVAT